MEAPTTVEDCCVKVAVHLRPLIGDGKLQGCADCVAVVPRKPQVQLGTHSFTFDHVYGSTGTPSSSMFEECVSPLVDGLFQGYNATVLAYGQTGSGKTYTMGSGCKDGSHTGIIPQAMNALFNISVNLFMQSFTRHIHHHVDLAGSERAKRTGSDGMRFKEGRVHINKGLLALGNVISALGFTWRKQQNRYDCPADINAEETLNTLKYANRARNIQNKPVVNRVPVSSEMLKMRQQLEFLQAELCARGGDSPFELQALRERIAWLEATNEDLCRELHAYRSRGIAIHHSDMDDAKVDDSFCMENEVLKRNIDSSDYQMSESDDSAVTDEEDAKEREHTLLQDSMDKELHELNERLEQKEHFGKKIMELEDEKRAVQKERDRLQTEIENLAASSDGQTQKLRDLHSHKLKSLIQDLKKKKDDQVQNIKQKQKSDEAAKKLQDEIQFIKAQKVQLQHRIKQEAEQFRVWKASREKELLQASICFLYKLSKERKVLQRKTEEAAMATKRLKELMEARKSTRDNSGMFWH
ncbi:hypothetical protein L1987_51558 [Smallanthus sonchifolius]|uniref:Uncharacterized protein n=1 Tax=Smallanthus sonchifolius TaxID=185202 RepID=A0ACB9ER90_9ASTR|nr:hypothetical protein L1987_51558 [Smallanthus sonchifolius]